MQEEVSKGSLRRATLGARALLAAEAWKVEDERRSLVTLAGIRRLAPTVVALFASRPGEPATPAVIASLHAAGVRVLLPVLRRQPDWADFTGWDEMTPSWGDILEPTGPRLGAESLRLADVIVVPALAVGRDGTRLGTGGGWYDRALPHRRPGATIVALARADEVLDGVPVEQHDIGVGAIATEQGWVDL